MTSSDLNASLTSVAKGATIIFGGLIAGNILGIVNQIILGRYLGPENYGLFNLSMSVVMIAGTLSVFGLFGALPRFIPYHLERNERNTVRSVIDFGSLFSFSLGVIFAVVIFLMADRLAVGIFHDARLEPVLKIFAVVIPIHSLQQVIRAAVRGFKAVKYDAILFNIGTRIVTISVFLLSLLFVHRLYGAVIAFIAGIIVTTIVSIWLIRKRIFPDYHECRRVPIARNLLSFSWPLALTGFTYLFVSKTDKVLLGYFLSSRDVGIYTPALVIASLLIFISSAFKYIFLPIVSEYFSKKDMAGLEPLFKSTSKWNFLIVLPIFLFILMFPKEILTILYGSRYTSGYVALIILSFGISINDFAGTSANILVAGGHTKLNLACEVIAAVTNIVLNVILIPIYGIVGAAVATGISYLTRNISSLSFVYRVYGIHPYTKNYLNIVFSGLVGAVIVYILKIYSPFSWWATMLILGTVFIVIYMAAALFSRSLDKNDHVILEAIERRTGIKLGFIKKFI
ncbi:MAG: flippase [Candidatus Krumholzibacteria bacterium]|nr:flippase [Candidatus Krumholzibacteria bacterium]